jgi:hypothetical protein
VALNAAEQPRRASIPLPAGSPPQWQVIFGPPGSVEVAGGKLTVEVPPIAGLVLHAPQSP